MKKLILELEHDYIAFFIALIGVLLIGIPDLIKEYAHILLGIGLILLSITSLLGYFLYDDKQVHLGKIIVYIVLGIVIILEKGNDMHSLGIMWAVVSLNTVSEEINEYFEKREFSLFRAIMIIISLVLALMLLIDPAGHFSTHIRVLGVEVIASVFVREHHLKGEV